MNLQHLSVKIPVDGPLNVDWQRFIEVFHGWVAAQSMDEMMIDVADYRHVPHGPGVVMVGHEADYSMDNSGGVPGLRFLCKIAREGTNQDKVQHAFRAASTVCRRLEQEIDGLNFSQHEMQFVVNDRALAPNNEQTYDAATSELPAILAQVVGTDQLKIEYDRDPRHLFGATVRSEIPFSFPSI